MPFKRIVQAGAGALLVLVYFTLGNAHQGEGPNAGAGFSWSGMSWLG